MHGHWRLQEAKQRFSELIESVEAEGPFLDQAWSRT